MTGSPQSPPPAAVKTGTFPAAADWILIALLALAAGLGSWALAKRVPDSVTSGASLDVYFSSDCGRVLANMRSRLESDHHRTNVHPLFSIIMHPVYRTVAFVTTGAGAGEKAESPKFIAASQYLCGVGGAVAMALFFAVLRAMGTPRADSVVYCILGASSAFAIFWFTVPETYAWGSISILFALLVAAIGCSRPLRGFWYWLASLGSFAITTTNWMVGLLATWTRMPFRKAFLITVAVCVTASGLSIGQKLLFPSSWFFFNIAREKNYVMQDHGGGPAASLRAMIFHTAAASDLTTLRHPRYPEMTIVRMQGSAAGGRAWYGKLAAGIWMVLLAGGVWALIRHPGSNAFRLTLGLSLAGQFVLHLVYGAETFLYSAHFGPLMILVIAFLSQTRFRLQSLACAAALAALLFVNNLSRHTELMALIRSFE